MSWYIHHRGEHSNRCYAEIYEHTRLMSTYPIYIPSYPIYGPYPTKEAAIKAAEARGLTPHSLADKEKEW